ncbi:MAG: polysaccharide biosynthesis tyrosine autokinase [Muribaculaceae bacterium]|nr:polysaccharide biosynthesis tyrosine autokinase [Muribaculaceae bacterium]
MEKNNPDIIDFGAVMRDYRKHWYWFVISLFVCGLIGLWLCSRHKNVHVIAASVLIDKDAANGGIPSIDFESLISGSSEVDNEVYLISSHSIYVETARELGLDRKRYIKEGIRLLDYRFDNYPVDIVPPAGFSDTTTLALTFKVAMNDDGKADYIKVIDDGSTIAEKKDAALPAMVKTEYGDFTVEKTADFDKEDLPFTFIEIISSYHSAAEDIDQDINAYLPSKKANVIGIEYKTAYPKFGKTLVNTIIEKYNERAIRDKNVQGEKTLKFLDGRIALLRDQLGETERQLQSFKEDKGIVDFKAEAQYNLQMKGEVAKELITAQTDLEVVKLAREFLATPGNEYQLVPYTPVSASKQSGGGDGLTEMITQYNKLIIERMDVATNAKGENATLKRMNEQLDAMRANILSTLTKTEQSARLVVSEMRAQMDNAENRLGGMPAKEREYVNIERDRKLNQEIYLFMLKHREETAIMIANAVSKGIVIDEAYQMREPVNMGKKGILAIALLFGLMLPLAGIYLRRMLRSKVSEREEVEALAAPPVLGEVCVSRLGKALVCTPGSNSSAAELFRLIRANLQFILTQNDDKVVLVTSSRPGEGKSFVSINTAASLSLLGKKVLLVGADIRKPRLAEYLGIQANSGLTGYLANESTSLDDIICRHPLELKDLDIVVAGAVPPNPSELLLSKRVDSFFQEARQRYDYIIVDTAPLGIVSDTFSLARVANASIYVTRLNVTLKKDIQFVNTVFEEKRLPRMNVVINGTASFHRYGYGEGEASAREGITRKWWQFWKK